MNKWWHHDMWKLFSLVVITRKLSDICSLFKTLKFCIILLPVTSVVWGVFLELISSFWSFRPLLFSFHVYFLLTFCMAIYGLKYWSLFFFLSFYQLPNYLSLPWSSTEWCSKGNLSDRCCDRNYGKSFTLPILLLYTGIRCAYVQAYWEAWTWFCFYLCGCDVNR